MFGSSPRMRGKLFDRRLRLNADRIIPAHAGQTSRMVRLSDWMSDHPRACGANPGRHPTRWLRDGSSPRMRGKHGRCRAQGRFRRIIPAHAGQTWICRPGSLPAPDHPRACGANPCRPPIRWTNIGSSPRMRGKLGFVERRRLRGWIIPAHAGQTTRAWNHPNTTSDHPRACGANRPCRSCCATRTRIIPAHAGQTTLISSISISIPDHPRACGANGVRLNPLRHDFGSSPRMRGKPPDPARQAPT